MITTKLPPKIESKCHNRGESNEKLQPMCVYCQTDDIVYFVFLFPVNRFNNGRVNDFDVHLTKTTFVCIFLIFNLKKILFEQTSSRWVHLSCQIDN